MPSAIKRRKVSSEPRKAGAITGMHGGIDSFTSVSKSSTVISSKLTTGKLNHTESIVIAVPNLKNSAVVGQKRKAVNIEDEAKTIVQIISTARPTRTIKSLPQKRTPKPKSIPQTPRKPILLSNNDSVDTPTKGARGLLDRLFLSSRTPTRSPLKCQTAPTPLLDLNTPPCSQDANELPSELLDLINLHAAFLTALSLHYAHNGTNSPADLRMLCPNIARTWGKRGVTLEDIQRTLGVLNTKISSKSTDNRISHLTLSDYGHGKICIEIALSIGKAGRIARPVNENLMNELFVQQLRSSWESKSSETETKEFTDTLPMEHITTCTSLVKGAAVLAKGQRRLQDFKMGIIIMKEAEKAKAETTEKSYQARAKPTLLERLRAKQLDKANAPPPATKEELDRKAAMQKIAEVAAVLAILSTSSSIGQQRVSFTLPTILGKLKDSLNTPISKNEGECCIRLLANEIAPEWVKMVKMGKVEAVVVNRDERPTEGEILERVGKAS